ncbi:hypothetical protein [Niabella hibiscisoli]|uniref:hypothetical protein n=1 Tax=Niabella hibiscisoli TaxID=1825928 RepID=UPI001F0E1773|nr:hypothetical protein [Niabella hibiscisoli]MCH5718745.1 hypothetical protein [Niabella hibiscisoli]
MLPFSCADKEAQLTGCHTILWDGGTKDVVAQIRDLTEGRSTNVCIDAVGFEPSRNILEKAKAVINFEAGSVKVLQYLQ